MSENNEAKQEMDLIKEQHPTLFRLAEDFVLSFERMACALEGLRVVAEKCQSRYFPDRKPAREANVTHVLTEEDKLRQIQGASEAPDPDAWLREFGDPEEIGARERAFLEAVRRHSRPEGQGNEGGAQRSDSEAPRSQSEAS